VAAKYRNRPVFIEAMLFLDEWSGELIAEWAMGCDVNAFFADVDAGIGVRIVTPDGVVTAGVGDWVIRGVDNNFHVVKPDIFELTYEEDVEETEEETEENYE
jgi:hypothetical protein